MSYIRTLDEVSAASLALVGGKGANLGELVRAGVPVPAAYCVTTDAYRAVLDANGLHQQIAAVLEGLQPDDPAGLAITAERIRALVLTARMPPGVAHDINAGYRALEQAHGEGVAVSVRSSATAEDLPGFSFAGQQDTYLHVSGPGAVLTAVQRCWASLWTDRAIAYRQAQGFDHGAVHLAVVVQVMFASEVAGVLFTANPLTSNPDELLLNASWGLGEAVVSGHVNPDQLLSAKGTFEITERRTADKAVMTSVDPSGQGSVLVAVPEHLRTAAALTDATVRELCELGQRIEDHFGFYQDIEWGWAGGRLAILQARPITGANLDVGRELEVWKAPRALADLYDPRWVWSRAYSDEVQTGPSTPSFYTYLQRGMTYLKVGALQFTGTTSFLDYGPSQLLDFPYFRWYGARAYYNTAFERERIRRFIPPFARDDAALWPFPAAEREEIRNLPFDWDQFFALLQHLQDTRPDIALLGTTQVIYEGLERWTDEEDAYWQGIDVDRATVAELFAAQAASRATSRFGENVVLPFTIYLYLLPAALRTLCELWFGDDGGVLYGRLLGGLQTKTAEENQAVWQLCLAIKASPTLAELVATTPDRELVEALRGTAEGAAFLDQLDAFLATYGHRGGAERDAYHPRWRDDPTLVFRSVRVQLGLDEDQSPPTHEARQREAMLAARASCITRLEAQGEGPGALPIPEWLGRFHALTGAPAPSRAGLFAWFVDLVQDYVYYRDFERFYNDKTMSRSRAIYEAIARRFVAAGLLADPDDVFFLGREEMLAADTGGLTAPQIAIRVRARRAVYDRYTGREPPKYLRGWEAFDDDQVGEDGALVGIGASAGVVTGRARVCRELGEIATVERGEILVTVATDPGWTTVFSMIGGVVVETGGVVAHAVMISREYGLPCVANLTGACDLIPDGATITVDGTTGRVSVHP